MYNEKRSYVIGLGASVLGVTFMAALLLFATLNPQLTHAETVGARMFMATVMCLFASGTIAFPVWIRQLARAENGLRINSKR